MSETENARDTTLTLAPSKTLHLKQRQTEHGMVRQSFSHGRSKVVVVEKVKRRGPGHGEVKLATPTAAPPPATLAGLALAPGKTEAPSTSARVETRRRHSAGRSQRGRAWSALPRPGRRTFARRGGTAPRRGRGQEPRRARTRRTRRTGGRRGPRARRRVTPCSGSRNEAQVRGGRAPPSPGRKKASPRLQRRRRRRQRRLQAGSSRAKPSAPKRGAGRVPRALTEAEREARARALVDARGREEEDRRRAEAEAKARAEREAREKEERAAADLRKREEEARRRLAGEGPPAHAPVTDAAGAGRRRVPPTLRRARKRSASSPRRRAAPSSRRRRFHRVRRLRAAE